MYLVVGVASNVTMAIDQFLQPVLLCVQSQALGRLCRDAMQYQKFNAIHESRALITAWLMGLAILALLVICACSWYDINSNILSM